ncbi:MAG: L-aspartate oxidase [Magnetococcales bacterium]|nr:L-aspartate oxidase [Magnetococcales bacterium]
MVNSDATYNSRLQCDFLIIGSGVAGLDLALRLARHGQVILLTKKRTEDSNSFHAQGGIAAVMDPQDRPEAHVRDTLEAGAGLCAAEVVRLVVEQGAPAIKRLIDLGVDFTRNEAGFHLTREGGHSARRVIHTADATGAAVTGTLLARAKATDNILILQDHIAIDLITAHKLGQFLPSRQNRCYGCYALNTHYNEVVTVEAPFTILATGGMGKVYLYTSNPDTATGDGIAMAYRAGCRVANMEFVQFHPTCLFHPSAKSFLISEAVRGEGGVLLLKNGSTFMEKHHPKRELAPRDIVARAIDYEMKSSGDDCVFLDIHFKGEEFLRGHFPTILQKCREFGIDITREPIPVVPAAHYACGGVVVDTRGRTDLGGLYAIGETSHSGLHGANRLASNSLLECLVYARQAEEDILALRQEAQNLAMPPIPLWDDLDTGHCKEGVVIAHNWDEIRRVMWNYVGIVRSNKRLTRAYHRIELLKQEVNECYWNFCLTPDLIELRNLALVASLVVRCAIHRKESRGLHYNTDHPHRDDAHWCHDTILPLPGGLAF